MTVQGYTDWEWLELTHEKLDIGGNCIEWQGSRTQEGYGITWEYRFGKKVQRASQLSWIDAHGRLPTEGMFVLHHCDNPPCINVEHLWLGSHLDNMRDCVAKGRRPPITTNGNKEKVDCPKCGGEYSIEANGNGRFGRRCKECRKMKAQRYRDRHREDRNARERVRYHVKKNLERSL